MIDTDIVRLLPYPAPGEVESRVQWFQVSGTKLIVMSLVTLGLYELYWFYKQWVRLNESGTRAPVCPLWRATFTLLFCFALFSEIERSAIEAGTTRHHETGFYAVAFIALSLTQWLPGDFWLIFFLNVVPLMMVQRIANDAVALGGGTRGQNRRFSGWNWLAIVPGTLMWLLLAVAALLPAPREDPTSQAHLATLAARMNQDLPRSLDAGTTLVAVSGLSGTLVYNLRLTNQEAVGADVRKRVSSVTTSLARWECGDEQLRPYMDLGVTMRHVYEDRMGKWVATLDVSRGDCGS